MYKNYFDGYEAILFDLDGTVVHSDHIWEEVVEDVFSKEIISENPFYGERGQNLRSKIFTIVNSNEFRSNFSEDTYYKLITDKFFENIKRVEITPGFQEFADFLRSKNIRIGLVTNTDSLITNRVLEEFNLKKYFDLILTADDVVLPKPAPEIYKLAITKLGIPNYKILVFEDSVNGAFAAELAELKMIIVLPDQFKPTDYGSKNRVFIENFENIVEQLDEDGDTFLEDFFRN